MEIVYNELVKTVLEPYIISNETCDYDSANEVTVNMTDINLQLDGLPWEYLLEDVMAFYGYEISFVYGDENWVTIVNLDYEEEIEMTNHVFIPNNFGVNDNILRMYFGDSDIQLTIGSYKYHLESDENSYIEYHMEDKKVLNSIPLRFKSETGIKCSYTPSQLFNFKGIKEAIEEFIEGGLEEGNIRFDKSTDELMGQIMDFHKEELVNKHLDNYNKEELQKLSLIV